jgi:hypothetical protein
LPLETWLAEIWTSTSGTGSGFLVFLVLLVFWYLSKLGFDFSEALSHLKGALKMPKDWLG